MELLVIVAVAVAAIAWFLWKDRQFEQSDSHPLDGDTKAPEPWPFPTGRPAEGEQKTTRPDRIGHETVQDMPTLTNVLDVNQDGKVDLKDARAAAEVVVETTKKTAKKAKTQAEKVVAETKKTLKKTAAKVKKS